MKHYLTIPLLVVAFFSIATWHFQFAGGLLVLTGILWEVADNKAQRDLFDEVERYANDRDPDR